MLKESRLICWTELFDRVEVLEETSYRCRSRLGGTEAADEAEERKEAAGRRISKERPIGWFDCVLSRIDVQGPSRRVRAGLVAWQDAKADQTVRFGLNRLYKGLPSPTQPTARGIVESLSILIATLVSPAGARSSFKWKINAPLAIETSSIDVDAPAEPYLPPIRPSILDELSLGKLSDDGDEVVV
jgi:hypothetical protein